MLSAAGLATLCSGAVGAFALGRKAAGRAAAVKGHGLAVVGGAPPPGVALGSKLAVGVQGAHSAAKMAPRVRVLSSAVKGLLSKLHPPGLAPVQARIAALPADKQAAGVRHMPSFN